MQLSKKLGFTLIEVLIVVSIIGILAAIVLSSVNKAREKSRVVTLSLTMKEFMSELYQITDGENGSGGYWWNMCPTTTATAGTTLLANEKLMNMLNNARALGGGDAYCVINHDGTRKWALAVELPDRMNVICVDYKGTIKKAVGGWNYGTYSDALDVPTLSCK